MLNINTNFNSFIININATLLNNIIELFNDINTEIEAINNYAKQLAGYYTILNCKHCNTLSYKSGVCLFSCNPVISTVYYNSCKSKTGYCVLGCNGTYDIISHKKRIVKGLPVYNLHAIPESLTKSQLVNVPKVKFYHTTLMVKQIHYLEVQLRFWKTLKFEYISKLNFAFWENEELKFDN